MGSLKEMTTQVTERYLELFQIHTRGRPLGEQLMPWTKSSVFNEEFQPPMSTLELSAVTRNKLLTMRACEKENWLEYHIASQLTKDISLKKLLWQIIYVEHKHQSALEMLIDPSLSPNELLLALESQACEAYQQAITLEPDESIKSAYQLVLSEHNEHACLFLEHLKNTGQEPILITEGQSFSPRRPLQEQYRLPVDNVWHSEADGPYKKETVAIETVVNIRTLIALEGALVDWQHHLFSRLTDEALKLLVAQVRRIEEQHLVTLESLVDPAETLLDKLLCLEFTETENYRRFLEDEAVAAVKKMFQQHYLDDLEQGYLLGRVLTKNSLAA